MPPNNEAQTQEPIGIALMADLVKAIVIANESAKATQELLADLLEVETAKLDMLDTLNGHLEALATAADEVAELSQDKSKITIVDFCQALAKAEAEVFSEDDGKPE